MLHVLPRLCWQPPTVILCLVFLYLSFLACQMTDRGKVCFEPGVSS
uniref:Uncharacterized protein n=1 Tax=Rhizophora mucronata TaxID=61149 RepID=A0A2P2J0B6_RHIMU